MVGGRLQGLFRQAEIEFFDLAAGGANQMMVVSLATHPIPMSAVAHLDAIQKPQGDQRINCAVNGSAPKAGIALLQFLPQFIGGKVAARACLVRQPLSDEPAGTRVAQAGCIERGKYVVGADRRSVLLNVIRGRHTPW